MQIRNEFALPLPPRQAYELLLDLDRVTPCMPGATLGADLGDGSRGVNVSVKLGPMRFSYDGTVRIAEQDDAALRAVLVGAGKESRGQGSANAAIAMQVEPAPDGSRVSTTADIDLSGRAAQMGHGMVESVSKQLIGQFTERLAARFSPAAVGSGGAGSDVRDDGDDGRDDALAAAPLMWAAVRDRVAQPFRRGERGSA